MVFIHLYIHLFLPQVLTTIHMEFEALEDEASAIHGDLWEQLNAGGQVKFNITIISVYFILNIS